MKTNGCMANLPQMIKQRRRHRALERVGAKVLKEHDIRVRVEGQARGFEQEK